MMSPPSELDLPPEIVTVLPADPYEQLEIARKITSMAITSRVGDLESSTKHLTRQVEEKDFTISHLERRVSELQLALEQSSARLSGALENQVKLTTEKESLEATVKKLTKDVAKLEAFKRTLMHSLREDEENQTLNGSEKSSALMVLDTDSISNKTQNLVLPMPSHNVTPPMDSPRRTSSSPKVTRSGAISPKGKSMKGSSKWHSVGVGSVSLPTSNHSTAPNSPPHIGQQSATTPRVDGKEFFRKARNRLTYEQFNDFLANVKELNAHRQTREETLKKVHEIFGFENEDLFSVFDSLLNRHLPSHDDH